MRADGIVVFAPRVQDELCFDDRPEDVAVQAFVAQLASEAFDERVLHGLARSNEVEAHAVRIGQESIARLTNSLPLSTVVAAGGRPPRRWGGESTPRMPSPRPLSTVMACGARRCCSPAVRAAATLTPVNE